MSVAISADRVNGFQVASDLLGAMARWESESQCSIPTGFVEAGVHALVAFDEEDKVITEPIINAIVSALLLAGLEPSEVDCLVEAVRQEFNRIQSKPT